MKVKVTCEDHKPLSKSGQSSKCACKYLNRNWAKELKLYKNFMKAFK